MEALLILFVIAIIGVLLIGSIMGLTSSGRISKLEKQNRNLNERLKVLEAGDLASLKESQPIATPSSPLPSTVKPTLPTPSPAPPREAVKDMHPQPTRMAASNVAPEKNEDRSSSVQKKPLNEHAKPKPAAPQRNLEELIGGQWSVWVGGLALLVGAILLIRFSIEAGVFGPGARIFMAAVLGGLLLLAGEWFKRSDDKILKGKLGKGKLGETAKALQANASVPGLLSAVGIFTLLGTTYAAHELYGFISAPVAFVLLGAISLAAMALSFRQGPLLAAIGLLASFATPLLIQTQTPNFMALVGYLLVIGFAALMLARRTNWRWLEAGTVFGWLGWLFMSVAAATSGQLPLWSLFLAIGFGVTVWLSDRPMETNKMEANKSAIDWNVFGLNPILSMVWGAVAAVMVAYVVIYLHDKLGTIETGAMGLVIMSIALLCVAAVFTKHQAAHLVTAGFLAVVLGLLTGPTLQVAVFAVAVLAVVLLSMREALGRDINPVTKQADLFWPIFAVAIALSQIVLHSSFNHENFTAGNYAAWAAGYTVLFCVAALFFHAKSRPTLITAIWTLGAGAGWVLIAQFLFEDLQLSLALSAGAALMAAAIWGLRLPGARAGLLGLAGLVFSHAFLVQFPEADSLSAKPMFNALWVYLALPTAILGVAGFVLHNRKEETDGTQIFSAAIEAAALAGLALFAVFQIRHLSNDGSVYVDKIGFAELGLQVATGLCFTLAGLSKRFAGNFVLSKMAEVISYATLGIFALGSLLGLSPLFNSGEDVTGNAVFNTLTTGLLVPTVLLCLCAWRAQGRRPDIYVKILGGLALAGIILWVTAMIRYLFNGTNIDVFGVDFSEIELWTISAIWLAIGIGLLALGVWRKIRALRIASGVMIILTVLKAFLIDMSGIEGVLRALSFVVLGLVLIVIGRAYQRFWLSDNSAIADTSGPEAEV